MQAQAFFTATNALDLMVRSIDDFARLGVPCCVSESGSHQDFM